VSLAVNQMSAPSGDHAIPRALVHIFVSVFLFPDKSVTVITPMSSLIIGCCTNAICFPSGEMCGFPIHPSVS
jgi:hypothetical protein